MLQQHMTEGNILFALVSEPVYIPGEGWYGSKNGMAANLLETHRP